VFDSSLECLEQIVNEPPAWWQGAIIYQIYPRSFQDTNGMASATCAE